MDNSGTNTIILVVILALIVGGMVWFFKDRGQPEPEQNSGIELDINVPQGESDTQAN